MTSVRASRQRLRRPPAFVVLAAAWQIRVAVLPALPVSAAAGRVRALLRYSRPPARCSPTCWRPSARIFAGLAGAFIVGALLALVIGRSQRIDSFVSPILTLFQGIPALSWVVFAIIWFHGIEFRIFFIMVMTTLPAFTFQVLDACRSMSKDLFEMTMSFRPSRWKLFRVMIVPTILPDILTAWKVNLGNASRVVVVAELVGATGGVGYELLQQQQLFDMAGAIAWTLQLVFFVLIVQQVLDCDREPGVALSRRVGAGDLTHDVRRRSSAFDHVTKEFGRPDGRGDLPSRSTSSRSRDRDRARWWRCSARPAAASRRSSTCSPG